MDSFFGQPYPFYLFQWQHYIPLLISTLLILHLFRYRHSLRTKKWTVAIRYGVGGLLLMMEIALYAWYYVNDRFYFEQSLPLQLCGISYLLTIIMLIFPSQILYEFLYFAGIGGALQALITPVAILSGFPHFTYFYFFLGHGAIVWVALYMTWVHQYRPKPKSIWRAFGILNLLLIVIIPVNMWTGGNYFFIAYKPGEGTLLDFLGPWPWYILSMELVAIIVFHLLYLPFYIADRRRSKMNPTKM